MARWARLARPLSALGLLAVQREECRCELQSLPVQRHVSRADHDRNKLAEHLAVRRLKS